MTTLIVSIGECMLEPAGTVGGPARLACGGDTFNTTIHLAGSASRPAT